MADDSAASSAAAMDDLTVATMAAVRATRTVATTAGMKVGSMAAKSDV